MSKKEDRKQEILKYALNLFVEKGYHQTLTSEISEKAGIASGTLFNYFNKKEDLINNLYQQVIDELYAVMSSKISPDDNLYNLLKLTWINFVFWGVKNYNKVLFLSQMRDSPIIAEEIRSKYTSEIEAFFSIYQQGINQGFLKEIPIVLGIEMFFNAMLTTINYIVKFEIEATEADQAKISKKAFNNYLYGTRL